MFSLKNLPQISRHNQNPRQQSSYRWFPPPTCSYKLNVDGAIFYNQKKAGVGIILRDSSGNVVLVANKKEEEVPDPSTIEILAMFRGLQICANIGIQNLILENDCLLMISEIQTSSDSSVPQ